MSDFLGSLFDPTLRFSLIACYENMLVQNCPKGQSKLQFTLTNRVEIQGTLTWVIRRIRKILFLELRLVSCTLKNYMNQLTIIAILQYISVK